MNNLNLNLLKVFMCVAMSNSFLEASKKLYISQPAISKSIKTLEEELNVNLFYRGNKGICLTPDGETLLKYVKEAYSLLEAGERMISKNNDTKNGSLIIGVNQVIASYALDIISKFKETYPGISIKMLDIEEDHVLSSLEKHNVDFVISSININNLSNEFSVFKLTNLKTCFIKNSDNKNAINDIYAINKSNVILPSKNTFLRSELDKCLDDYNIKLKPTLELSNYELVIEAIKNNMGIGFVIENNVKSLLEKKIVSKINIVNALPVISVNLITYQSYLTKPAQAFIDMVKKDI